MPASSTRIQTEAWLKQITVEKGKKVIDIGAAVKPMKDRIKSFEADEYIKLDIEDPFGAQEGYTSDIIFDLSEHMLPEQKWIEHFDVAFAIEVYEHCWNPVQALENSNAFLRKGGVLYATFPFIYPRHNPPEGDYVRYTEAGARKILEETGFQVDKVTPRITTSSSFIAFCAGEYMRPTKKIPNYEHEFTAFMIKSKKL